MLSAGGRNHTMSDAMYDDEVMRDKAWMRATRERLGLAQADLAMLTRRTADMVKKWESDTYPAVKPNDHAMYILKELLKTQRHEVSAIVAAHRGEQHVELEYVRVSAPRSESGEYMSVWDQASRRNAAVREAAALMESEGATVTYKYSPEY